MDGGVGRENSVFHPYSISLYVGFPNPYPIGNLGGLAGWWDGERNQVEYRESTKMQDTRGYQTMHASRRLQYWTG